MKKISVTAGCTRYYTNHCLRETTCTLLDHGRCVNCAIMSVSSHRSETSIKYYVTTSEEKKEDLSNIISATLNQGGPSTSTVTPGPSSTVTMDVPGPSTSALPFIANGESSGSLSSGDVFEAEPLSLSPVEQLLNDIAKIKSPNALQDVINTVCNVNNQVQSAFNLDKINNWNSSHHYPRSHYFSHWQ